MTVSSTGLDRLTVTDIRPVLQCQDCGAVIKVLSPEEVRRGWGEPQYFVIWCGPCGATILRELRALDGAP